MPYLITTVLVVAIALFLFFVADPWLREQIRDQSRWLKEQERLREEAAKLKRKEPPKVGDFLKFVFPVIRRPAPSLIASQIVSIQPMTSPIGGITFYRPRYGEKEEEEEELHTVLDDIVAALATCESDPEWIADQIVREAFKDCPYSTYYQRP